MKGKMRFMKALWQKFTAWRYHNYALIGAAAAIVLIIGLVLLLTLGGGDDHSEINAQTAASDAVLDQSAAVNQGGETFTDETPAVETGDIQNAENGNMAEPAQDTQPQQTVSQGFVFVDAYVDAVVHGKVTGPELVFDTSKIDPSKLSRWPQIQQGYIPILTKAETDEKIIAITVDDCFQGMNLRRIVQCAIDNNSKLTIFPCGKNLEDENVAASIRYAYENGMEIENHTYNHVGMYKYDDTRMMQEMWYQKLKVDQILGVNYQQHFFRPRGGDERKDQRMHAYANQMGIQGVAIWTKDGSNSSKNGLVKGLAPGNIYLFHSTDNDLSLLLDFIPKAVQQGYKLVTMNEMFGLPENEVSDLSTVGEMPQLQPFNVKAMNMQNTTYANAVFPIQQRLIELGWLEGEATGMFGDQSYYATGFFQMAAGLDADGIAGVETQRRLFSADAPRGSKEQIQAFCDQLGVTLPTTTTSAT